MKLYLFVSFSGCFFVVVGFGFFCLFFSCSCLEVSNPVFGLLWLPSERQEAQGPSLSLLRPPMQVDANECIAEVPHLAAHSKSIS